jgi:HK97 family phage prohead protease
MLTRVHAGVIRRAAGDQRTIRAIINTEDQASDGLTLLVSGMDASRHLRSRTVLFSHVPEWPIARTVDLINVYSPTRTEAVIRFSAAGISPKADEVLGQIRDGVLNSVSIGFTVDKPPENRGGRRVVTAWSLLEISVVAVPALASAEIIERKGKTISAATHSRLSGHLDRIIAECEGARSFLDTPTGEDMGDLCDPADPDFDQEACDEEEARARRQRDLDRLRLNAAAADVVDDPDAAGREQHRRDLERLRQGAA